jgi:hypothetical protein
MSLFAYVLSEISFFEVAMSLLAVGVVERFIYLLPAEMVGPGGWLLDTGTES